MKGRAFWMPAVLAICACVSTRMTTVPSRAFAEVDLNDVRKTLEAGDYLRALQDLDYLARRGDPEVRRTELTDYRTQALGRLQDALGEAVERRDFVRARSLYRSLEALGETSRAPEWSEAKLMRCIIEEHARGGDLVSASIYLRRAVEAQQLSGEDIAPLRAAFEERGAGALFERVLAGTGDGQFTPQMLRGTVTIWVDRGIRFEGGVGLPDRAMGSGFFIDESGRVLTNYHVIQSEVDPKYEGYSRLYVRLPKRPEERIPAKVVAWDPVFDLAVLKTSIKPDYVFPLYVDPNVVEGERVLAIGSPVDPFLENTVTSGIVSGTGRRRLLQMGEVVQVDAAVNPGNSGGPLLNEKGDLVGVVFAGIRPYEGLNFAIPQHWVRKVLPALLRGGEVPHPWLGLALMESDRGLEVIYAVPGGPSARAGLEAGSILETVDGRAFKKIRDLQEYLLDVGPETLVRVDWRKADQRRSGVIRLEKRPRSPVETALERDARINVLPALFGLGLESAGGFLWEQEYRVRLVVPGSVADDTGLSEGDTLALQMWRLDTEQRYAVLQIFVKGRKAGYLERVIQLAAYLDPDNFV